MQRLWVLALALPCAVGFMPGGTLPGVPRGMALRAGAQRSAAPQRPVVGSLRAALSDDKDIKPSDALKAASPAAKKAYEEAAMEAVTAAGRKELQDLAELTKKEQEELKQQLAEVGTLLWMRPVWCAPPGAGSRCPVLVPEY